VVLKSGVFQDTLLGGTCRRLLNVSDLSTICIIVKCRSFRVLTKAMFFFFLLGVLTTTIHIFARGPNSHK
jgi:hypothetical protein